MPDALKSRMTPHFSIGVVESDTWIMQHPLPLEGCILLLCSQGQLEITVNSKRYFMKAGDMAFMVFDMLAVPIEASFDFSAKFIALDFDTAQDIFFLVTSNRFWDYIYTFPVFSLRESIKKTVAEWFALIDWLKNNCSEAISEKALRNEMENFMLVMAEHVETHYGVLGTNPSKNRAWLLANEFLGLLNRYYSHHHDVAFYAERLNITPNYLNIISKRILGSSAKEQINGQLVMVVKMLLHTTELSVKEIADRLHYDDSSYLCRIFRKHTGLSPLQYRNYKDNRIL